MSYIPKSRGFVMSIVLLIVAFILLKYFFGLEPKQAIDAVWSYIRVPATFAWDRVIWPLLSASWENFQHLIHNGTPAGTPAIPQI